MKRVLFAAASACLFLVAGCSADKGPPYRTGLELKEVMGHVIDFGAQTFWHSAGFIDTAEGTRSLTPTTEEGWITAASGAATVAEGANILMLPDRQRDQGDWLKFAGQLADVSLEGMAAATAGETAWLAIQEAKKTGASTAAEEKNLVEAETKMFDTGGRMYEVCTACHEKYLLPFVDESGETKIPDLKKKKGG